MSLESMAAKGKAKYAAKKATMVTNYAGSVGRAVAHYKAVGFGGQMSRSYEAGMANGASRYTSAVLDENKWEARWLEKARA